MINTEVFNSLNNLNYSTQLLESLSWDEEQLNALYEYLDMTFNADILVHPDVIFKTIEEHFGSEAKNCFEKIFNEVMLTHNLHIAGPEHEH